MEETKPGNTYGAMYEKRAGMHLNGHEDKKK